MIESAGYDVETAESAEKALKVARRTRPDVIISDIGMPDEDGFGLLKKVREDAALSSTPMIALTGFASSTNRDEALRMGFAAHLAKPVDQPVLIRAIDDALNVRSK
jgi:CheY-like chemotaxis protein